MAVPAYDPNIDSVWSCAFETSNKLGRAIYRCRQVADDEAVLGYKESERTYRETADEIIAARTWVAAVFSSRSEEVS